MQYSLDQYTLLPCSISNIEHRADIKVKDDNGKYRMFVAPMTCLLNANNFDTFLDSAFIPVYPIWNGEPISYRLKMSSEKNCWVALSLAEFQYAFCANGGAASKLDSYKVLIDCADGHMRKIFELVKSAKKEYKHLVVMTGNIAHPDAYVECCKAGIDYVRVSIGTGSGCTSSVKLGFHASMGWLLTEIQKIRTDERFLDSAEEFNWTYTKVIADGGCDTSARIIKCLALGADYVMCGKLFAMTKEACGEIRKVLTTVDRHYYGQASTYGKQDRFGKCDGHIEGTDIWVPTMYTLDRLDKELGECFSSAMSYGGARSWDEFIGKIQWDIQSNSEFSAYNKD